MLETIGLDAEVARAAARWTAATDASLGRVVRADEGLVSVLTEDGPRRASVGGGLLGRMAVDPTEAPCSGDWCVLRAWPDHRSTVERVLPRRTAVVRAVTGEQTHGQVLCSNVDIAALVVSLLPRPLPGAVERLVALGLSSGAQPLVVVTKCDLLTDAAEVAEVAEVADRLATVAPGVEVVSLSARTGEGVTALRNRVRGRLTLALVGVSGHGKSSLMNALAGTDVLTTRTSRQDGRGGPTSARRRLVPLPTGGAVIDTPGLRGLGPVVAGSGAAGPARLARGRIDATVTGAPDR